VCGLQLWNFSKGFRVQHAQYRVFPRGSPALWTHASKYSDPVYSRGIVRPRTRRSAQVQIAGAPCARKNRGVPTPGDRRLELQQRSQKSRYCTDTSASRASCDGTRAPLQRCENNCFHNGEPPEKRCVRVKRYAGDGLLAILLILDPTCSVNDSGPASARAATVRALQQVADLPRTEKRASRPERERRAAVLRERFLRGHWQMTMSNAPRHGLVRSRATRDGAISLFI